MKGVSGRRALGLTACAASTLALAASAASGAALERFHDEGAFAVEALCDVEGLDVTIDYVIEGRVQFVSHGPSGLAYFLQHGTRSERITNEANGRFVTTASTVTEKDKRVTDNGDGTLTILVLATGNEAYYGMNGKAIGRNPGQVRYEILVDHGGTPTDPSDDEFIDFLGVVKDSTGRSDGFCDVVVPALE